RRRRLRVGVSRVEIGVLRRFARAGRAVVAATSRRADAQMGSLVDGGRTRRLRHPLRAAWSWAWPRRPGSVAGPPIRDVPERHVLPPTQGTAWWGTLPQP